MCYGQKIKEKTLQANGMVPLAPSGFLAKSHLPCVLRQSRLSANDKGDDEMIQGIVHRYPCIYLTPEENPGKPQLGDRR